MASLFLPRAPRVFALGLGLSSAFAVNAVVMHARSRPVLCESIADRAGGAFRSYRDEAKVPVVTRDGRVNRNTFRQVSSGSILGLIGGVAVSTFSKTLAILIGAFIAGAQYLENRGINVLPTSRIQRYFKNIDVQSAVRDNVAFKITFGTTFALAAFAGF